MAKKKYFIVIDTETTNGLDCPLVYDMGFTVIDKKGIVYETYSFVIYDIFVECADYMETAYYREKIPLYEKDIAEGRRKLVRFTTARNILHYLVKKYNVSAIIAHNMRFDLNALNTTYRYITSSRYRYFFPYGVEIWCTLAMARSVIGKQTTYKIWCKVNGFTTKNGAPRFTAEILYRYITDNLEFIESHTGLEDTLIEKEIFAYCVRQKKKMQRTYWKEAA